MGKCIKLAKSRVAVEGCEDGGVFIEFQIETEFEEPLFLHKRLDGNITLTGIKLGKEATEALCALLADHLGVLQDE